MESPWLRGFLFSLLLLDGSCAVPQVPQCTVLPPELPNGTYTLVPGNRVASYNCNEGFQISGPRSLTCVISSDGKDAWMPEPWPECHLSQVPPCTVLPPELPNGTYNLVPGNRVASYNCNEGFQISGPRNLTCVISSDGKDAWMPEPWPECRLPQVPPCTVLPPELPNGTYTLVPGNRVASYNCNEGFQISGPRSLTCVISSDGKDAWMPEPWPECHPVQECPDINLENGFNDGECCAPGDKALFYCDEGYKLLGAESALCLPSGSWNSTIPTCQDTYCRDPGVIVKGDRNIYKGRELYEDCMPDGCPPGTVAKYYCDEEFELVGEASITCTENGTWTHTSPKCQPAQFCTNFYVANGQVSGQRSGGEYFVPGDSAFVTCDQGHRVNGTDQLYCKKDGLWDEEVPTCVEYNCTRFDPGPHLIVAEFANINRTSFQEGDSINFDCEAGYVLEGVFSTVCKGGGWFLRRLPKCEEIRCGHLTAPTHGWMGKYSTAVDGTAHFGCSTGYTLLGSSSRTCGLNGQWDGEPVRCVSNALVESRRRNECVDPGTPDNAVRYKSSFSVGSRVKFECNPGYYMWGNDSIRCEANRQWSSRMPVCVGKYYYSRACSVNNIISEKAGTISKSNIPATSDNGTASGNTIPLDGENLDTYYVYFLFDASTSIGEKNFRTGISLAKAITRKLNVDHTRHRIGAIVFEKIAHLRIRPQDKASEERLLEKLDKLKYTNGATSIRAALKELQKNIAHIKNHLPRKERRTTKFAAFLITDGKANIGGGADKTAEKLKEHFAVDMYCIGITGRLHGDTLMKIASKPENLFILRNYNSLQWLADTLTNGTIDCSVCGVRYSHDPDTGLDVDDSKAEGLIVGRTEVVTSWPWMVEISLRNKENQVICGGTIIHKKWVLTAASCLHSRYKNWEDTIEYTENDLRVRVGLIKSTDRNAKEFEVLRRIPHEAYNRSNWYNDIALLQLKEELTFEPTVRPICLPPPKYEIGSKVFYKPGKTAFVIGWGAEKKNQKKTQKHLMQIKTVICSQESCAEAAKKNAFLQDGMMCASSSKGDTCSGDSGGPLMQGVHSYEIIWTQVGIVSWGYGDCKANGTTFYTDVSHYIEWIEGHINKANAGGATTEAP